MRKERYQMDDNPNDYEYKMPTDREIQQAAKELGFNVPYHARVVRNTIEFHTRIGTFRYVRGLDADFGSMDRDQLLWMARSFGIPVKPRTSKRALVKALNEYRSLNQPLKEITS